MNEWGNAEPFILLPPLSHYRGIIKYLYPILENLSHIIFIVKFFTLPGLDIDSTN
jgi:hypothetical protein